MIYRAQHHGFFFVVAAQERGPLHSPLLQIVRSNNAHITLFSCPSENAADLLLHHGGTFGILTVERCSSRLLCSCAPPTPPVGCVAWRDMWQDDQSRHMAVAWKVLYAFCCYFHTAVFGRALTVWIRARTIFVVRTSADYRSQERSRHA